MRSLLLVLAAAIVACADPRVCAYGPYVQVDRTIGVTVDTGRNVPHNAIHKITTVITDSIRACQ